MLTDGWCAKNAVKSYIRQGTYSRGNQIESTMHATIGNNIRPVVGSLDCKASLMVTRSTAWPASGPYVPRPHAKQLLRPHSAGTCLLPPAAAAQTARGSPDHDSTRSSSCSAIAKHKLSCGQEPSKRAAQAQPQPSSAVSQSARRTRSQQTVQRPGC